ncbi:unnamed protein product [Paramecium primaurelia]|uniref:Transmembrane protein n=1 Tax=Paramecium primaurelia TaxID=5886 RepID=A0A8S1NB16_PARPR|nr:unnamed protein product [Paramecium primaurelia]
MIEQSDKNKQNDLILQLRNVKKILKDQKTQKQFIGNHTIFCRSRQLEFSIEILRCAYLSELRSCRMSKFPSSSVINGYFRCCQYYLDQEKQYSTNYLSKSFTLSSITLIIIICLNSTFILTIYLNLQISILITIILCNSLTLTTTYLDRQNKSYQPQVYYQDNPIINISSKQDPVIQQIDVYIIQQHNPQSQIIQYCLTCSQSIIANSQQSLQVLTIC